MRFIICLLAFVLISISVSFGQDIENIASDRPGQANNVLTAGKGVFQAQQGIQYSTSKRNSRETSILQENVLRLGLTENFEINTLINIGVALDVGMRYYIASQKGIIPATSVQVRLKLPHIFEYADYLAPEMTIINNWYLGKGCSITSNLGVEYDGIDPMPIGFYVLNFGFPITPRISAFAENFGEWSKGYFETKYDAGVSYSLNSNVLLDLYGGYGDNSDVRDFFVSTGVSWRIVPKQKSNKDSK